MSTTNNQLTSETQSMTEFIEFYNDMRTFLDKRKPVYEQMRRYATTFLQSLTMNNELFLEEPVIENSSTLEKKLTDLPLFVRSDLADLVKKYPTHAKNAREQTNMPNFSLILSEYIQLSNESSSRYEKTITYDKRLQTSNPHFSIHTHQILDLFEQELLECGVFQYMLNKE